MLFSPCELNLRLLLPPAYRMMEMVVLGFIAINKDSKIVSLMLALRNGLDVRQMNIGTHILMRYSWCVISLNSVAYAFLRFLHVMSS